MMTSSNEFGLKINCQDKSAMMIIPAFFLNEGTFLIDLMVINQSSNLGYTTYLHERDLLQLEILPEKKTLGAWMGKEEGQVRHIFEWRKQN